MKRLVLCLFLSGCALHPPYEPPILEMPQDWERGDIAEEQPACCNWWEALNDPTLNELLSLAEAQNLDLQIGALRVLKARLEANGKKGDLYPHLDGSLNCGYISLNKHALKNILKKSCRGNPKFGFFEIGFDASWELDFFGKTAYEIAAFKAGAEATEEELSSVWITLSAEIAKTYFTLRQFQAKQELFTRRIEMQKDEIFLQRELRTRGLITQGELAKTVADLSLLKAELPEIRSQIDHLIYHISILLGYHPSDLREYLTASSCLPDLPCNTPLGAPSQLLQRRPDIRKAERELAKATEMVGSAIASRFPRISLWGFIGDIQSKPAWAAGNTLLAPLFNSTLVEQDVEYNQLATHEALYSYQKTVLEALEEAESAISAYSEGEERVAHFGTAYKILEQSREQAFELFSRGVTSHINYLTQAKLTLLAEEQYKDEQVQQILRYIAVYKALGGCW